LGDHQIGFGVTSIRRAVAAIAKHTFSWEAAESGNGAGDGVETISSGLPNLDLWDGRQEASGVGMRGLLEHARGRACFDDPAAIHDQDVLAHVRHDCKIVGDEQQGRVVSMTRSRRSTRIWACTVTSRAVVGSSAMIRSGSHASASAITTRWRCPPES